MKTRRAAIVIIPPRNLCRRIQAIRKRHDRSFARWMPHIKLMYPFFRCPGGWSDEQAQLLAAKFASVRPFQIRLGCSDFGASVKPFRRQTHVWLKPLKDSVTSTVKRPNDTTAIQNHRSPLRRFPGRKQARGIKSPSDSRNRSRSRSGNRLRSRWASKSNSRSRSRSRRRSSGSRSRSRRRSRNRSRSRSRSWSRSCSPETTTVQSESASLSAKLAEATWKPSGARDDNALHSAVWTPRDTVPNGAALCDLNPLRAAFVGDEATDDEQESDDGHAVEGNPACDRRREDPRVGEPESMDEIKSILQKVYPMLRCTRNSRLLVGQWSHDKYFDDRRIGDFSFIVHCVYLVERHGDRPFRVRHKILLGRD